jgi:hypothetical protein
MTILKIWLSERVVRLIVVGAERRGTEESRAGKNREPTLGSRRLSTRRKKIDKLINLKLSPRLSTRRDFRSDAASSKRRFPENENDFFFSFHVFVRNDLFEILLF